MKNDRRTGRKIGRPTDFTPEAQEKIIFATRKGAPYELACNYAGVCYNTLLNWRNKSEREGAEDYVDFFRRLKIAQGETALKWLDKIEQAMDDGTWQAAAWKLERRHSKYFSSQASVIELNERLDNLEKGALKNDVDNEESEKET